MEPQRLAKTGELAETPEGKKALVNEEGKAFLVQESTIIVWDSFDKKTADEVAQQLAVASGRNPEEFKEPVLELAKELQSVGLLVPA